MRYFIRALLPVLVLWLGALPAQALVLHPILIEPPTAAYQPPSSGHFTGRADALHSPMLSCCLPKFTLAGAKRVFGPDPSAVSQVMRHMRENPNYPNRTVGVPSMESLTPRKPAEWSRLRDDQIGELRKRSTDNVTQLLRSHDYERTPMDEETLRNFTEIARDNSADLLSLDIDGHAALISVKDGESSGYYFGSHVAFQEQLNSEILSKIGLSATENASLRIVGDNISTHDIDALKLSSLGRSPTTIELMRSSHEDRRNATGWFKSFGGSAFGLPGNWLKLVAPRQLYEAASRFLKSTMSPNSRLSFSEYRFGENTSLSGDGAVTRLQFEFPLSSGDSLFPTLVVFRETVSAGQNSKDDAKLILDNQEEILNNSNILENLLQDKVHEKLEGILQRMRTSLQGQPDIQIYFETTLGDFYVTRLWRREYEWLV